MDGNICEKIVIDEDLENICGSTLDTIKIYLMELKIINSKLQNLLVDERWTGDAHDKCVACVSMMEDYRIDLEELCSSFRLYVKKVVDNAGEFINVSDKAKSIRIE